MEEKPKVSEAQKRASKKYLETNRVKINEQRIRYYNDRKAKDPNFLKYKRDKAKEYYNKHIKKPKENKEIIQEDVKDIVEIIDKVIDKVKILDIDIKF